MPDRIIQWYILPFNIGKVNLIEKWIWEFFIFKCHGWSCAAVERKGWRIIRLKWAHFSVGPTHFFLWKSIIFIQPEVHWSPPQQRNPHLPSESRSSASPPPLTMIMMMMIGMDDDDNDENYTAMHTSCMPHMVIFVILFTITYFEACNFCT